MQNFLLKEVFRVRAIMQNIVSSIEVIFTNTFSLSATKTDHDHGPRVGTDLQGNIHLYSL